MKPVSRMAALVRSEGAGAALVKAARYPFKPWHVDGALRRLHAGADQARTWPDLVRFLQTFNYRGVHIASWQLQSEIVALLELVDELRPQRVLEIGTARGGTLFMLTRAAADDAVIISIDLPGGAFGGEVGYPRWRTRLYEGFGRASQRMQILRADSHSTGTLETVKRHLNGRPLDFLFIDGDHTYEGVSRDWQMYAPLVREGGLIALHDIVPGGGGHGDSADVPVFWRELTQTQPTTIELVHDWNWGSCGIGVIRVERQDQVSDAPNAHRRRSGAAEPQRSAR